MTHKWCAVRMPDRIVDCRDEHGNPCPKERTLGITISRVNPVEAGSFLLRVGMQINPQEGH